MKHCHTKCTSTQSALLAEYSLYVILINTADLFLVYYIAKSPSNIVAKLNEYSDFALKYICLSCFMAVSIPGIISYCKAKLKLTVVGGRAVGKKVHIPW